MSEEKTIHYSLCGLGCGGGVDTYVKSLLQAQPPNVSPQVITSLKNIDQSQFKLLHVQEQQLVWDITGECPVVYTLHNHSPYCPSGSKYLASERNLLRSRYVYSRMHLGSSSRWLWE